jgi:hypothetical protein
MGYGNLSDSGSNNDSTTSLKETTDHHLLRRSAFKDMEKINLR